jgi:hypothetical protein
MSEMSAPEQTGRPGKYNRSAPGLVVALVTTVAVVAALGLFMGLFRHKTDIKPQHVDYLAAVRDAQGAVLDGVKLEPVYPTELPLGYFATQAQVPQDDDGFEIDLLRGDKDFIGIRVAKKAVIAQLVHEDIDPDATDVAGYVVPDEIAKPLARRWDGHRDTGGDVGYSATIGNLKVLVYGSAPAEDIQQVVDRLTTAPLPKKK